MAPKGLGWIIIDSLDTMMLMNLTTQLVHAREWLSKSLTWDQDQDVNTFETTIRMLGGLLSAHYLSNQFPDMAPIKDDDPGTPGEDLYLEKARDLADRLLSAFDTPSGVPYASVNLGKFEGIASHDTMGASSTAETTTLQLEFKYLAKLTGEKVFWDKVEKVMQVVDENNETDGLVPIYISPSTGKFVGSNIRLGSRGDSYYEYLIKQYLQTNKAEKVYEDMWYESLAGVRKHLVTYTEPSQFTIIGERPDGLQHDLSPKMDHLVCFMPGTIALAATGGLPEKEARRKKTWTEQNDKDMKLARELMHTCWGMYKYMATGLAAEITYFNVAKPPPNSRILIFGAGTVGLSACLAAKLTSPEKLVVVDHSILKLAMLPTCIKEAATDLVDSSDAKEDELVNRLKALTRDGQGYDYALDCVGRGDLVKIGHLALRSRGTVVTVGGSTDTALQVTLSQHLTRGITYKGTHQGDSVPSVVSPYATRAGV